MVRTWDPAARLQCPPPAEGGPDFPNSAMKSDVTGGIQLHMLEPFDSHLFRFP